LARLLRVRLRFWLKPAESFVIDDIDRLPIAEISETVQLVSVNADFPNFDYPVLFDPSASSVIKSTTLTSVESPD
jgi:hypothetical protein